jgi:hypothetical protein
MELRSNLGQTGLRGWLSYGFIVPWSCQLMLLVHLKNTCFRLFVLVHRYCHFGIRLLLIFNRSCSLVWRPKLRCCKNLFLEGQLHFPLPSSHIQRIDTTGEFTFDLCLFLHPILGILQKGLSADQMTGGSCFLPSSRLL